MLLAGSRDDLGASLDDSKHEVFDNAWSNVKVETMQDYQTSDNKLNAQGKFLMLVLILTRKKSNVTVTKLNK